MREIKFRGKGINNGEWVYGYFYVEENTLNDKNYMIGLPYSIERGTLRAVKVHPESVGQYTGLKDKNGVEIYEGDILRVQMGSSDEIMKVYFEDGYFGWGKDHDGVYSFDPFGLELVEVLGNIYENKELLK